MNCYLLNWNPEVFEWINYSEILSRTNSCFRWRIERNHYPEAGAYFFLLRKKKEPEGIIGFGKIITFPYPITNSDGTIDHSSYFVDLRLEQLLNIYSESEKIIPTSKVKSQYPNEAWDSPYDTTQISDETVLGIMKLWYQYVNTPTAEIDDFKAYEYFINNSLFSSEYETDPKAREICLGHYGYLCRICGIDMSKIYGDVRVNVIQLHHIRKVSGFVASREKNPSKDLIPICPNCHLMIHSRNPPLQPIELQLKLK